MLRSDILNALPIERIRMSSLEFFRLPEYSTTLPTGVTIGKRWRRDRNFMARRICGHLHFWDGYPEPEAYGEEWVLGEYVPDSDPALVGIKWRWVELTDPPVAVSSAAASRI